jgi:hypothetical protein
MEGEAAMTRLLLARTVLAIIGVVIWFYGYRANDANIRLAGIIVLAVSLLLRFVPKRWFGDDGMS